MIQSQCSWPVPFQESEVRAHVRILSDGSEEESELIEAISKTEVEVAAKAPGLSSISAAASNHIQHFCEQILADSVRSLSKAPVTFPTVAALCHRESTRAATLSVAPGFFKCAMDCVELSDKLLRSPWLQGRRECSIDLCTSLVLAHPQLLLTVQPGAEYEDAIDLSVRREFTLEPGIEPVHDSSTESGSSSGGESDRSGQDDGEDDCEDQPYFHGPLLAKQLCNSIGAGFAADIPGRLSMCRWLRGAARALLRFRMGQPTAAFPDSGSGGGAYDAIELSDSGLLPVRVQEADGVRRAVLHAVRKGLEVLAPRQRSSGPVVAPSPHRECNASAGVASEEAHDDSDSEDPDDAEEWEGHALLLGALADLHRHQGTGDKGEAKADTKEADSLSEKVPAALSSCLQEPLARISTALLQARSRQLEISRLQLQIQAHQRAVRAAERQIRGASEEIEATVVQSWEVSDAAFASESPPSCSSAAPSTKPGSAVETQLDFVVATMKVPPREGDMTECADSHSQPHPFESARTPQDPQLQFDEARRIVALSAHEEKQRARAVTKASDSFMRDALAAALAVPAAIGMPAAAVPQGSAHPVLRVLEGHGIAGGCKLVHDEAGLFLKTPDDSHGIYGSLVMAAKVMKLEAKATQAIHGMGSVHISAPLTVVLDVPYGEMSNHSSTQRVQVQARLPVSESTLRFGSPDGGQSLHTDRLQLEQVVRPLASRFHLAPIRQGGLRSVVSHKYSSVLDPTDIDLSGDEGDLGEEMNDWLLDLQRAGADVHEICEVYDAGFKPGSAHGIDEVVRQSRAHLGQVVEQPSDLHCTAVRDMTGQADGASGLRSVATAPEFMHELPFDVEVHQLPSGQRVVLDTHRLLIPDSSWIQWIKSDPSARPRVWALGMSAGAHRGVSDPPTGIRFVGQFESMVPWPNWLTSVPRARDVRLRVIIAQAKTLCTRCGILDEEDDVEAIHLCVGAGCVLLRTLPKPGTKRQEALLVVSCPAWYWGRCAALTVMLPVEAAAVIQSLKGPSGEKFDAVSPDCMLRAAGASDRHKARSHLLSVTAALQNPDRLAEAAKVLQAADGEVTSDKASMPKEEAEQEQRGEQYPVPGEPCSGAGANTRDPGFAIKSMMQVRRKAKEALKSMGLCLRHTGHVHAAAGASGLPPAVLWACCLPSRTSPSGLALLDCIQKAQNAMEGILGTTGPAATSREWTTWAAVGVCVARAFAARGATISVGVGEGYHYVNSWISAPAAHKLHHDVAGAAEALVAGLGRKQAEEGGTDWSHKESSVSAVLGELGHVQRVGGQGEVGILLQLARIGSRGAEYRGLALRALARAGSLCSATRQGGVANGRAQLVSEQMLAVASGLKELQCLSPAATAYRLERKQYKRGDPGYLEAMAGEASCLEQMGKLDEALEIHQICRKEWLVAFGGKSGVKYLQATAEVASCLRSMGRLDEAVALHRECLEQQQSVLGDDHPSVIETLACMGLCLRRLGRHDEALAVLGRCRDTAARVLGEDDPEYLGSIHNIALCMQDLGRHEEALEQLLPCQQAEVRVLGQEHPSCLLTSNTLANSLRSTGRAQEALDLLEKCLEAGRRVFGENHLEYLSTLHSTALCLQALDRHTEALERFKACGEAESRVLGKDHPHCVSTSNNTGSCLLAMGRAEEALELHESCKARLDGGQGTDTEEYASTLGSIAACLRALGRLEEAEVATAAHVQSIGKLLGESHPEYVASLCGNAECKLALGQVEDALDSFRRCEAVLDKGLDGESSEFPLPLRVRHGIARCVQALGRYGEALDMYRSLAEGERRVLGAANPEYLSCKASEGQCLHALGRLEDALKVHRECLEAREKTLGRDHRDVLTTLGNTAGCLDLLGRLREALPLHTECFDRMKAALGDGDPQTCTAGFNMAQCLRRLGRPAEAAEVLDAVLPAQTAALGESHPAVGASLHTLGLCRMAVGRVEEGTTLLEAARGVLAVHLPADHPVMVGIQGLVGGSRAVGAGEAGDGGKVCT